MRSGDQMDCMFDIKVTWFKNKFKISGFILDFKVYNIIVSLDKLLKSHVFNLW